jgi:filamentous hemagglutinin
MSPVLPIGVGLKGINAVQAVGGAANAAENLQNGNYLGAALDAVGVVANAAQAGKSCFAAGTPLLTPTGDKPIAQFRVGDWILSAPEDDPDAPLQARQVEEVFVRVAPVLYLHVGGQVIHTTAEHPFFVLAKGWRMARELVAGDGLRGADGRWVAVEAVTDTGAVTTVYNLAVAEYHTYFVGARDWGFAVWAHNYGASGGKGNIRANQAKGQAFEDQVIKDLQKTQDGVVQQVTVRTQSGTRTRLDVVGRARGTGAIRATEAKSSATAPLTKNQKKAFPEIESGGAVVVGNGKPGFPGGTVIPPTKVEVVRP